jgi:hypothetical protein
LVAHVGETAALDGSLRLSLVTESDNAGALALYAQLGVEPVTGDTSMPWTPPAAAGRTDDR